MNYNSLINKPTLNHKELIGDNKASDVGGMTEESMQELLATDLTPYYTKAEIDELFARSYVYREKSGSIVTFECPNTAQSIPEVTSGIEATQDLNGYDNPWPAGGGKNKFQTTETTSSHADVTYTINTDGTVSLSGTSSGASYKILGTITLEAGNYILNGGVDNSIYLSIQSPNYYSYGSDSSFTVSEQTTFTMFANVRNGINSNGKVLKPMIRLASVQDATFAPYSNECPITGKSEVNVYRTSKNLVDISRMDGTTGITYSDGVASGLVTSFASAFNEASGGITRISDIKFPIADRLTISLSAYTTATAGTTGAGLRIVTKYTDGTTENLQFGNNTTTNTKQSITTAENKIIQSIYFSYGSLANTWYVSELQVELGTTATEYETFSGTTYTIDLDGTRYGGTLDVVSGVLTVTSIGVDYGDLSWIGSDGLFYSTNLPYDCDIQQTLNAKSSIYKIVNVGSSSSIRNGEEVVGSSYVSVASTLKTTLIRDTRFSTASDFKTALTGQKFIYKLATPQTIQLTPTAVKSILGTNNIWADSGDITVKALDKIIQE